MKRFSEGGLQGKKIRVSTTTQCSWNMMTWIGYQLHSKHRKCSRCSASFQQRGNAIMEQLIQHIYQYGTLSFIMEQVALRLLSWCYLAWLKSPDNGTAQKAEFCSIHPLFHTKIISLCSFDPHDILLNSSDDVTPDIFRFIHTAFQIFVLICICN